MRQGYRDEIGPELPLDYVEKIKAVEEEKKKPLDPGKLNIKVRARAASDAEEEKEEVKQQKKIDPDELSEQQKVDVSTALDSITKGTSNIQREIERYPKLKKSLITGNIKNLKNLASGIIMTKGGNQVSFVKKDIDANTKILLLASKTTEDEDLKKKIEDIL